MSSDWLFTCVGRFTDKISFRYYNYKMDIWSIGCVMYEIMTLHPLFPGANEVDQVREGAATGC